MCVCLPFTVELPLHPLVLLFEVGCSIVAVLWKFGLGPYISCLASISIGPLSRYFCFSFKTNESLANLHIDAFIVGGEDFYISGGYLHYKHFVVVLCPCSSGLNAQMQQQQPQLMAELVELVL